MVEPKTTVHLPIFDISKPLEKTRLASLIQACREWGFFHITNHGVPSDFFDKLNVLSGHLFSLPSESKLKIGPFSSVNTYTPLFIASPFFESIRVSGPDFYNSAQSSVEALGQPTSEFSEVLKEYGSKMTHLSETIIRAILMSLSEEEDANKMYESEFKNCHGYLRINNYTPPTEIKEAKEEVEGLGKHTDMSCITIVYQDKMGGLQVKSEEGQWMDINPNEGTLLVNVGDLMQAWSNDKLRSSEHRVVLRQDVNRQSMAFFWCFEDDKIVHAPDEVLLGGGEVNADDARMYKPFVCSEYMKFRHSVHGKFEKVGFTVKDFAGIEDMPAHCAKSITE